MSATRRGGSSPEEALELSLQAIGASDLDQALPLMTGPEETRWREKIQAYGPDGAQRAFAAYTAPVSLVQILDREELAEDRVIVRAKVQVERGGGRSEDGVTYTFDRNQDGLWRLWSA